MAGYSHDTSLSAGVVFYSYCPETGQPYFLMGREADGAQWRSISNRWSDFGGMVHDGESAERAAAREAVEECAAVVDLADRSAKSSSFLQRETLENALQSGNFTIRVDSEILTEDANGSRTCFVKEVPWQPDAPRRFRRVISLLEALRELPHNERRAFLASRRGAEIAHHPALRVVPCADAAETTVEVNEDFMEKKQIEWWSLARLRQVLEHGGKFRRRYCFRFGFLPTLAVIMKEFTPRAERSTDYVVTTPTSVSPSHISP